MINLIEKILSGNIVEAKELFEAYATLIAGKKREELRQSMIPSLYIAESSTHEWFRSLSTDQQASYLKMHPKSELKKYFKLDASGKVVTNDEAEKDALQKQKLPKEEKKLSDVKVPKGKEKPVEKEKPKTEDDVPSGEKLKAGEGSDGATLDSLRAKQKPTEDYDKTPAKEIKGQSAQDILVKSGSPTDMTGPDAESGKEGSDAEFEREFIAGLSNLATEVSDYKARKKEAEAAGKEFTEPKPEFELCHISVPGTNLFCSNHIGVPREDMPQLSGEPEAGSKADSLPKDKNGGVSVEKQYAEQLSKDGIKTSPKKVDVATLKATQTNLSGEKIAGMVETLKVDPQNEALNAPIYVSKDGYILDGHHRWAALMSLGIADGLDEPVAMNVVEVDMGIEDLLDYTNKFTTGMGIKPKAAGETTENKAAKPQPK